MDEPSIDASTSSLAKRLCDRVLKTAREVDGEASISTVSKWDVDNATLVRVRSGLSSAQPLALLRALKASFPLATVSSTENLVNGHVEAQILLPSHHEQCDIARELASQLPKIVMMRRVFHLLVGLFVLVFAVHVASDATR